MHITLLVGVDNAPLPHVYVWSRFQWKLQGFLTSSLDVRCSGTVHAVDSAKAEQKYNEVTMIAGNILSVYGVIKPQTT